MVEQDRWYVAKLRSCPEIVIMHEQVQVWSEGHRFTAIEADEERERVMSVFSKAFASIQTGEAKVLFDDAEFAEQYPTLFTFMAQETDDAGKPRQTSTLLLLVEQGQAKGCLKERDHDVSLWVSAGSILGVLAALEKGLNASPVAWRTPFKPQHRR